MKKIAIVLLAALFALSLCACSSSKASSSSASSSQESSASAESSSASSSSSKITAMGFAQKYNTVTGSAINDIQNVGSNSFKGTSYGYPMSMNETKANLIVEIENNGDYAGMKSPFVDAIKVLDASQADAAGQFFDDNVAQLDPAGEDVVAQLGNLNVFFSPQNDAEIGHVQIVMSY